MSTPKIPETGLVTVHRAPPQALVLHLPKSADPASEHFDNVAIEGSANTRRGYAADLRSYEKFCEERELNPYPGESETLKSYVSHLANTNKKLATIHRHLAAIEKRHQLTSLPSAVGTPALKRTLRGITLTLGKKQKQAPAFTVEHLKSCIEQLDLTTASGLRDRALLLIGFAGAFRRSELVGLNIEDLKLRGDTMFVGMGRTKTNQLGEAQYKALFWAETALYCPIKAFQDWVGQLGGRKKGPLFVSIRRGRTAGDGVPTEQRLSTNRVNILVGKHLGEFEPGVPYTAHSFRSSFITTARLAGQSSDYIKNQTNHKSDAMIARYTRLTNVGKHNAGKALGL